MWEKSTTKSNDFNCYYIMKQYYEQCSHGYLDDTVKVCADLATGIRDCRDDLSARLPPVTPSMLPLPLAFQPRTKT